MAVWIISGSCQGCTNNGRSIFPAFFERRPHITAVCFSMVSVRPFHEFFTNEPAHECIDVSRMMSLEKMSVLRKKSVDHVFQAEWHSPGDVFSIILFETGRLPNPTCDVWIHCANALPNNFAPWLLQAIQTGTTQLFRNDAGVEFDLVCSQPPTMLATLDSFCHHRLQSVAQREAHGYRLTVFYIVLFGCIRRD